jgi:phosphatidylserine/phosphatidylglycerophosphate/cardiolipin synthase-like enzyme
MTPGAAHIPPVSSGAYPVREGNFVRPLVDGEPAFRRICEAVDSARHSVWVTVAFINRDIQMPDGRGSFFDVLDRAAERGLDVRALFWRFEPYGEPRIIHDTFWGDEDERAFLHKRGSRFLARWDHNPGYCHHQKSWLIDGGQAGEIAFVGGINLHPNSIVSQGHPYLEHQSGSTHDVYVELRGPAATDVHHNFVQRWNGASECGAEHGYWPAEACPDDLEYPSALSPRAGDAAVQLTRTVRAGAYTDGTPPPGGEPHPIADGDGSMLDQYVAAIDAAQESIYFENQAIGSPVVVERIEEALRRGVDVTFLVPGRPHPDMTSARKDPGTAPFFEQLAGLGKYENFLLAGIAGNVRAGEYHDIYVHAKVALIDDAWATIGSTNVANRSFYRDTELNASFWHPETVRSLRVDLLKEHLGVDTSGLVVRDAMQRYRDVAQENAARKAQGEPMTALAHALDPAAYGS